jgi:hypothetical protein
MIMKHQLVICRRLTTALIATLTFAGIMATPSLAAPVLELLPATAESASPGERLNPTIALENVGDEPTSSAITLVDTASAGFAPPEYEGITPSSEVATPEYGSQKCETAGRTLTCTLPWGLNPGEQLLVTLKANVEAGATGTLENAITVSGGGIGGKLEQELPTRIGLPGPFAFSETAATLFDTARQPDVQAGSDPAEFTTKIHFSSFSSTLLGVAQITTATGHFKDVAVNLPVGFVGNPTAATVCTAAELAEENPAKSYEGYALAGNSPNCPADSQVGIARVVLGGFAGEISWIAGLYNMVPPPGAATELGFQIDGIVVTLDAYVRPGDSGITVVSRETSSTFSVTAADITVWGVPADPSHDPYRDVCLASYSGPSGLTCPSSAPRKAFLRMPTSCSGQPLSFNASANSYEQPNSYIEQSFTAPELSGCELLPFSPEISVFPTGTAANSPTGVSVRVSLPQNSNPEGLAEADLKKAVVTLPEGMAINPSAADGLQACTDAQLHLGEETPAQCPEASKVGTVLLHTPLLSEPIEGDIYVMTQASSDPESGQMFRIAMELRNDQRGIDIKIPGSISINRNTGRLTTTFDNNPQLPFSDITLSFKAGARAPLVTPASCQTQTTEAAFYSWAQPELAVHRSSSFNLTSGADGTACPPPSPFAPGFNAGVPSVQAGGLTPFLTTFTRSDADQSMQRVSVKLPPGLSGSLSSVALCGEAQANAGTCGQASEIGTVTAGAGAGPTPFYVTGGKVYITGPYEGAPFGLSVVVPAKAGPFDLGTVVVRAKVEVDPHTAQLTVTTDALPQIVSGVPVNLRLVNVTINRPGFTFNPTNCDPMSVQGTMTGGQGASAALSERFQVTNCGALAFKPKFAVKTQGHTSRLNGASLNAKLTYPTGAFGTEANIAKVKVSLPKQLPSRLPTLQKACLAATFAANPANCPAASAIGTAKATTPILPVPLEGPVYFVSHGGEAFPDLVVVLQGYGVTIDLVGNTFISKTGITSTTFNTVPDVPVGTFELNLPEGPYSALAAIGDLCKTKLKMPTKFIAQDGTEINQTTPITTTNCPKTKKKFTNHKKARRSKKADGQRRR